MHTLVLMRHGETEWSRQNRFAGWSDVDLSPQGVEEARRAGDWSAADLLRRTLEQAGIRVEDTPSGPRWHTREKN